MASNDPRGAPQATHSLGEIAGGLAGDVGDLVRGELALARAEFDGKLHSLIGGAITMVGGALVAFAGLVVLLLGLAAVLAMWLPLWASLLIVGVFIVFVGGPRGASRAGAAFAQEHHPPTARPRTSRRTVASSRSICDGRHHRRYRPDRARSGADPRPAWTAASTSSATGSSPASSSTTHFHNVTGGDGADFTQTLIAKAKANPVPAALTAIGIAWLMASNQQKGRKGAESDLPGATTLGGSGRCTAAGRA